MVRDTPRVKVCVPACSQSSSDWGPGEIKARGKELGSLPHEADGPRKVSFLTGTSQQQTTKFI